MGLQELIFQNPRIDLWNTSRLTLPRKLIQSRKEIRSEIQSRASNVPVRSVPQSLSTTLIYPWSIIPDSNQSLVLRSDHSNQSQTFSERRTELWEKRFINTASWPTTVIFVKLGREGWKSGFLRAGVCRTPPFLHLQALPVGRISRCDIF